MQTISETLRTALDAGNPQRCLLVFEDDSGNETEEFTNEDIVVTDGIKLTALYNSERELTIGLCPSAQIRFTMLNDNRQLSQFEFGTFRAYLGARIDTGTPLLGAVTRTYTEDRAARLYEFSPLGVFITERPDIVDKNVIEVSANDRMTLFDRELTTQERTALAAATTLSAFAVTLCQAFGVELVSTNFLNNDLAVSVSAATMNGRTGRDVLRWVAEAAGSVALFNRDGELEIRWFNPTEMEVDEHGYSELATSWYQTQTVDSLKVRNRGETAETTKTVTPNVANNPYVISGNPFLR